MRNIFSLCLSDWSVIALLTTSPDSWPFLSSLQLVVFSTSQLLSVRAWRAGKQLCVGLSWGVSLWSYYPSQQCVMSINLAWLKSPGSKDSLGYNLWFFFFFGQQSYSSYFTFIWENVLAVLVISYVDKWQVGGMWGARICLRFVTGWQRPWAGVGHLERLEEEAHPAPRIGFAVCCSCIEVHKITTNQKWDVNWLSQKVSVNLVFPFFLPSLSVLGQWHCATLPSPTIRASPVPGCVEKLLVEVFMYSKNWPVLWWEPGSSSLCREVSVKTGKSEVGSDSVSD